MNMTKALDIQIAAPQGSLITDAHFGLNFVSDYERIGTRGWEQFDNIVNRIDVNYLRYPGGSTAETLFDFRNPNRVSAVNGNGETVQLETLDEFIDFCNKEGINPTIIVPTRWLLTSTSIDGHRTYDASNSSDLIHFFKSTLAKIDPNLKVAFEIGNEYESYMTSTEYGRIANAVTQLISEAHSQLLADPANQASYPEPEIFVQVWGYSVGGGMTYGDLADRNQQVLSQFTTTNRQSVDGLVSHYYFQEGRNSGTDQAQTFLGITNQVSMVAAMHRQWELASGKEMISRMSEWNILFRSNTSLGLQQINPLMEMFTSLSRNGFDALDFWSAQYHATSLADSSGRFMAAGALMDIMKPAVLGTQVSSTVRDAQISSYTFAGSGRFVAVLASTTIEALQLDIGGSLFPPGYRLVDAYSIGVDETTSDGNYKTLVGLPAYGEPDARILVTQLPISLINGTLGAQAMDSFESVMLVFTLDIPGRPFVYGTDFGDLLYGSNTPTVYVGGASIDTISYVQALAGIDLKMGLSATDPSNTGDVLVSVERVLGSSFSDSIVGTGEGDLIDGRDGDDFLIGGDGADTLLGATGNDFISGGNGSDSINAGSGDDWILSGGGNDTVIGGTGSDTLSFADFDGGVTVWAASGVVETQRGNVSFREVENFVGSNFGDRFSAGQSASIISGLDGDDIFEVLAGGRHTILCGDGDDTVIIQTGDVTVEGGAGKDRIVSFTSGLNVKGGSGDDIIFTAGSRNTIEGQEGNDLIRALGSSDRFLFNNTSDHDTIIGFNSQSDVIEYYGTVSSPPLLVQTGEGTHIFFGTETSVLLKDCFIGSIDDLWLYFS